MDNLNEIIENFLAVWEFGKPPDIACRSGKTRQGQEDRQRLKT